MDPTKSLTPADYMILGNDILFQWWAALTDKPIPAPQYIPGTPIPTQVYQDTTRMLIVGGLAVIALVLVLKK